jgi:hypothetical protein
MNLSRLTAAFALSSLLFTRHLIGQTPATTTPPAQTPATPAVTSVASTPPTPDPKILEDGGFYLEPIVWLTRGQPDLFGGATATSYGNLTYPGKPRNGYGFELGIPAGRANTIRLSAFRVLGHGDSTVGAVAQGGSTIFSELYSPGDFLVASYTVESAKVSWDYLSYTFKNKIRFKTLYEMQFVTIGTSVDAPFAAVTYDPSTGENNPNSSTGSKNIFLPTFGVEFEQPMTKHLRWELKGSGFGIPHHADIWDAQADVALRLSAFEIQVGARAYHFKTSPSTDQYFTDTLDGAYVGIRYYLSKPTQ